MKKLFYLTFLTLPLFGASLQDRVATLENEMQSVYIDTANKTSGATFAAETPASTETSWFVTAEVLYWHAKAGGTEYAIKLDSPTVPMTGNMKDCDFDWDWGLRFGLGKHLPHDQWSLYLTYTYFDTSDTESVGSPFGASNLGPSGDTHGKFSCTADYQSLDFVLGKGFFLSRTFSVHPFLGVKSSWIDHFEKLKWTDVYNGAQAFLLVSGRIDNTVKSKSNFWGFGPNIGTNLLWHLGYGFKFFSDVSGTLYYSYFKVSENDRALVVPNTGPVSTLSLRLKGNTHRFIPQARVFAGLSWGTDLNLNQKKQYFDLGLGYEVQYFWRVIQHLDQEDATPQPPVLTGPLRTGFKRKAEDLSYYGLTFRARLDF